MSTEGTYIIVNLKQISENCNLIRNIISNKCKIMAVVKANAYGHGSVEVSKELQQKNDIQYFAVACLEEAIELRRAGIKGEILILGYTKLDQIYLLNQYNLTQAVFSYQYAEKINKLNNQTKIHIEVDTGMSRTGFYCHDTNDIEKCINQIKRVFMLPNLKVTGFFTHFAESDKLHSNFTELQFNIFKIITDYLVSKGYDIGLRHCCNSAAILQYPNMHLDMIRPGILLYGFHYIGTNLRFKPAMELKSTIIQIKQLRAGDFVSYERSYLLLEDKKIATIDIGYAEGYSRLLSNRDYVLVKGKKASVVGNICMDSCMIDVSEIDALPGDEVTIFGNSFNSYKSINEIANILGTINYEVLCMLSNKVRRKYIFD